MARMKPQALLQQSKKKKSASRISLTTIFIYVIALFLLTFLLRSTYTRFSSSSSRSSFGSGSRASGFEGEDASEDFNVSKFPRYAVLSTTKGSISVELFKDSSIETVKKFIELSQKGHFKGTRFYRVIKHFVVQAGNADKPTHAEDWISSGKHHSQLNRLEHEAFMLGTAKGKHDDKSFELFITTAPIPDLNKKLVVFGQVVKGQDVVQEIEELDTDELYRPKSNVDISSVTFKEKI